MKPSRHLRLNFIQVVAHARPLIRDQLIATLLRQVRTAPDVCAHCGYLSIRKLLQRIVERLLHEITLTQLRCYVHGSEGVQVYQVLAVGAAAVQDALAAHGALATATENLRRVGAVLACGRGMSELSELHQCL